MPYAAVIFEEPQFAYDVAKEYKEHVDSVRRDRSLEEFLEARLVKLIITHISNPFRVEVWLPQEHVPDPFGVSSRYLIASQSESG